MTTFENKCEILADVWLNYRQEEDFAEFIIYNDLGLPLAYAVSAGIVTPNGDVERFIVETFDLLLSGLGVIEDTGFDTLEGIIAQAADDNA